MGISDLLRSALDQTPEDVRGGEPLIDPIIEYPHTYEGEGVGVAVAGGSIYENATIPALRGKFVFGDYSKTGQPGGSVFAAIPPGNGQWPLEEVTSKGYENGTLDSYVLGVQSDARGEFYLLTTNDLGVRGETGAVRKIKLPSTETTTSVTATPERPPTATSTTTPTSTSKANQKLLSETMSTSSMSTSEPLITKDSNINTTGSVTTRSHSTGESEGWISQVNGPGFGMIAAFAAFGGAIIRLLSQRE